VECGGRGKGVTGERLKVWGVWRGWEGVTGERVKVCGVWRAWEGSHWRETEGLWSVEGVGRGSLERG
jgi:hypothetical protein